MGQGSAGGQRRERFAPDMKLIDKMTIDYPMFMFDDKRSLQIKQH